eukprot:scaffold13474_cov31-Tisochrysis_lutea.AAC.1
MTSPDCAPHFCPSAWPGGTTVRKQGQRNCPGPSPICLVNHEEPPAASLHSAPTERRGESTAHSVTLAQIKPRHCLHTRQSGSIARRPSRPSSRPRSSSGSVLIPGASSVCIGRGGGGSPTECEVECAQARLAVCSR